MTITLIAAMDRNRTIGKGNAMPWRLPAEMAFFKANTLGKTVLMGRKTFESLGGKPLPNRRNIVLTRQTNLELPGSEIVHSVEEALRLIPEVEELMIIGGSDIYAQFLPYANKILLTEVETEIIGGDATFPEFDPKDWRRIVGDRKEPDERNAYAFTFVTHERL
ncbi:dihydrofolate reductase [Paenibacillus sp. PAMC21692]|uniref:dihydrofolate reductase n=1 Tax=Paenibacillus sp. PAMC21692 TaxID=2762320 RepID=UPI00164E65C2|nr:dihydrofolate reductase [Paenibacillus sp. PAMC21692]QNK55211.1 dihydrofolate reductase [Paenibacillus sp. PAMC21692]